MNIKKMITGLVLSMLLSSGTANADWSDVYFCQKTNSIEIKPEGEMKNYKLEKFQFKLDQTKNAMVFGSSGFFAGSVKELTTGMNWPSEEAWYVNDKYSMIYFEKGKFFYTSIHGIEGISSISADCDKF